MLLNPVIDNSSINPSTNKMNVILKLPDFYRDIYISLSIHMTLNQNMTMRAI